MNRRIRSIAMVDTDGGDGIGGYTYELAEGIATCGVTVDVYANTRGLIHQTPLPRHHRVFPVLGRSLISQRHSSRGDGAAARTRPEQEQGTPQPESRARGEHSGDNGSFPLRALIRDVAMSFEFALFLKRKQYDLVWVQWPSDAYASRFYSWCHLLGMPVVHTVHNVLPHEPSAEDMAKYGELYRKADVLVVHSHAARRELEHLFPHAAGKTVQSSIGLYTMFRRDAAARHRARAALNVADNRPLLLFFGGIRPYKNVDALLAALRAPALREAVLVVAGREAGYPESDATNPLAHTHRRAEELGVLDRLRFWPGRLDLAETTALFEASDLMVLPYTKSYGSAALLLGMTFGKHIVATRTGGMDEYLAEYPRHTFLDGCEAEEVREGVARGMQSWSAAPFDEPSPLPDLAWPTIAERLLTDLNRWRDSSHRAPLARVSCG